MDKKQRILDVQTRSAEPLTAGDMTITPQSQALAIRWPGGGFVWSRPVAVLVARGEETERIPIVDVTLWTRVALFSLSAIFSIAALVLLANRKEK